MVYVDRNGNEIKNPDLTRGYLVDHKWIEHPAKRRAGHYEYEKTPGGGVIQRYVVDEEGAPTWREATVQMYIPYDNEAGRDS